MTRPILDDPGANQADSAEWSRLTDDHALVLYTIYDHPSDHPNSFVVRRWVKVGPKTWPGEVRFGLTLDEARAQLPRGVECLGRLSGDDSKIVETWI